MRYNIDATETAYINDADQLKLDYINLSWGIVIFKDKDTIALLSEFISIIEDKNNNSYHSTLLRLNKEQAAILGRILIELSK